MSKRDARAPTLILGLWASLLLGCAIKQDDVFALGEVARRVHWLEDATAGYMYEARDGRLYLVAGPGGAVIVREESRLVVLPAGIHLIGRDAPQGEKTP